MANSSSVGSWSLDHGVQSQNSAPAPRYPHNYETTKDDGLDSDVRAKLHTVTFSHEIS